MLGKPSTKLARRVLSEVDYDQRIEGVRLRERAGMLLSTMYSFTELVGFLEDPYPRIDLEKLMHWTGSVIQDHELQAGIGDIIASDASEHEKIGNVRDLTRLRLFQCLKMM